MEIGVGAFGGSGVTMAAGGGTMSGLVTIEVGGTGAGAETGGFTATGAEGGIVWDAAGTC